MPTKNSLAANVLRELRDALNTNYRIKFLFKE